MALSTASIDKLLQEHKLRIQYAFTTDGSAPKQTSGQVDVADESSAQTMFYRRNVSGCRLQLTAGPYARSHAEIRYSGRTHVGKGHIVDLRKEGRIAVEPRETITLLTNEYVEFPNSHWALVTPRVTMTDAGFLLTTAYVDPGYKGLLRVTLHNATGFRQEIILCEPIAQLFIFDVKGRVDALNRDHLANRSVFFGTNWEQLFNEQVDPFPRRKSPLEPLRLQDRVVNWWHRIRKHAVAAITAVGVLVLLWFVAAQLLNFGQLLEQLHSVSRLEARIEQAENQRPIVGEELFSFEGSSTEVRVPISQDINPTQAMAFTELQEGDLGVSTLSHLESGSNGVELVINVIAPANANTSNTYSGRLSWVIVP